MRHNTARTTIVLQACLTITLITSATNAGAPQYTITNLGPIAPWVPYAYSNADAVNNLGQIAGRSTNPDDENEATLWLQEPAYGLPTGPTALGFDRAYDINDLGQTVGFGPGGWGQAYLWDPVTGVHPLGYLPGGGHSIAKAINNNGFVVGEGDTDDPEDYRHGFLWDGIEMTDLGTFGGVASFARDINESNQIVGESWYAEPEPWNPYIRAALWLPEPAYGLDAGMHDIDDLSTEHFQTSSAESINEKGQIACRGTWLNEFGQGITQFWLWLPEPAYGLPAGMNDLRGYGGDVTFPVFAHAMNDNGEIVARSDLEPWNPCDGWAGVLWRGGEWYDLNDCIPAEDQAAWSLESALDINDSGQIAGWGERYGMIHGFLLTPVIDDTCPADVTGDDTVDVLDLLEVLASWGDTGDIPQDVNDDGVVDVLDLLEVLANWGPCS